MRNLALKYLDDYKNWGCASQQQMADILVGFAELAVKKFTDTQHTQPAKCLNCYHWVYATKARCSRGGGVNCVIKPGTQQESA